MRASVTSTCARKPKCPLRLVELASVLPPADSGLRGGTGGVVAVVGLQVVGLFGVGGKGVGGQARRGSVQILGPADFDQGPGVPGCPWAGIPP
jgi:hypothetical protein